MPTLQTVVASAALSDSLGPIPNQPIAFAYNLSGVSAQTSLGSVNTNASGIASVNQSLMVPDSYYFYASFAGASGLLASSGIATISTILTVDPTSITLMTSPNPTSGQTVTFSGTLEGYDNECRRGWGTAIGYFR